MSSFQNSPAGKAISFFSVLDLPKTWKEWVGSGSAKAGGTAALKAETSTAVTDYSITAGTAVETSTSLDAALSFGLDFVGFVGPLAVVSASTADMRARTDCDPSYVPPPPQFQMIW